MLRGRTPVRSVEQANRLYGLKVAGFTGPKAQHPPADKAAYTSGESVAVTSYSALFNINPFFSGRHFIVLDDIHTAQQYIAGHWSVRVTRKDHGTAYDALTGFVRGVLPATDVQKLVGPPSRWDHGWVEKLATPMLFPHAAELVAILDAQTAGTDLQFASAAVRDHIAACHLYVGTREILLRPLIPPTTTHAPFAGARQRRYMSATLGAGGELERLTGRPNIHRLPCRAGGTNTALDGACSCSRKAQSRTRRSTVYVPI